MTEEQEQELYRQALKLWGTESQLDMVVEECAELINAIQKYRRHRAHRLQIAEEIADVQNVINQFKPLYPEYEQIRQEKLIRLENLIIREKVL
jgi:hypothetical protein